MYEKQKCEFLLPFSLLDGHLSYGFDLLSCLLNQNNIEIRLLEADKLGGVCGVVLPHGRTQSLPRTGVLELFSSLTMLKDENTLT